MDDLDLYGDLGLSNTSVDAAAALTTQPQSNVAATQLQALAALLPAQLQQQPTPQAIQPTQQIPTSFTPGLFTQGQHAQAAQPTAPPQPPPLMSSAHLAVLAFQDAEVKEVRERESHLGCCLGSVADHCSNTAQLLKRSSLSLSLFLLHGSATHCFSVLHTQLRGTVKRLQQEASESAEQLSKREEQVRGRPCFS